jgi:hypothetical protein
MSSRLSGGMQVDFENGLINRLIATICGFALSWMPGCRFVELADSTFCAWRQWVLAKA